METKTPSRLESLLQGLRQPDPVALFDAACQALVLGGVALAAGASVLSRDKPKAQWRGGYARSQTPGDESIHPVHPPRRGDLFEITGSQSDEGTLDWPQAPTHHWIVHGRGHDQEWSLWGVMDGSNPRGMEESKQVLMSTLVDLLRLRLSDLQFRQHIEKQMHQANHMARTDPLTGIFNRLGLQEQMDSSIVLHQQSVKKTGFAVGLIDLDKFKPINDRYGHAAGDLILTVVARRLQACLRQPPVDLVARLGGDEFVLVMGHLPRGAESELVAGAMKRIEEEVCAPVRLDSGEVVQIGMSVGISFYPHDGLEIDPLLRVADQRMYQAKFKSHQSEKTAA